MAQLNEIIAAQDQVTPKAESPLEMLDPKQVQTRLLHLSGYQYHPTYYFNDAFEDMSAERAFALMVLASALDDIEPIDIKPPLNLSPAQITQLFAAQDKSRRKRIERQRKIEDAIRQDGRDLLRKYRQELKERGGLKARSAKAQRGGGSTHLQGKSVRQKWDRKLRKFNAEAENRDACNASLKWFCEERGMVEFWCHLADVGLERLYLAVDRRLALIGRCSIELHAMLKEMRRGREWKHEIEINPMSRYENRAWQSGFAN